jgi:hypothetical protein
MPNTRELFKVARELQQSDSKELRQAGTELLKSMIDSGAAIELLKIEVAEQEEKRNVCEEKADPSLIVPIHETFAPAPPPQTSVTACPPQASVPSSPSLSTPSVFPSLLGVRLPKEVEEVCMVHSSFFHSFSLLTLSNFSI